MDDRLKLEARIEQQRKTLAGLQASYDRVRAEREQLRRQFIVLWRDAVALTPDLAVQVDAETFEVQQTLSAYPLGTCEMCDARAPLKNVPDPNGSDYGMDVCAWGCEP